MKKDKFFARFDFDRIFEWSVEIVANVDQRR